MSAAPENRLLEISNLRLLAGRNEVLNGLDLVLERGEILSVIGPNGSGKTSLLRAVAGDLPPEQGRILLGGVDLSQIPLPERARRMGLLPQLSSLNFPFSAEEVVLLGRSPHATGRERDRRIVRETMAGLDILHLRHRLYPRLSGGEKQRVQIARILAQLWQAGEGLLLLDEPTSALDPGHRQILMRLLRELAEQGLTILMAVHDVNLAAHCSDRILALKSGRPLALGTPGEVVTREVMKSLFGVDPQVIPHPESGRPMAVGL